MRKVPEIAQLDSGESRFSAHDFGKAGILVFHIVPFFL